MMQVRAVALIAAGIGFSAFVHWGAYAYNRHLRISAPAVEDMDVRSKDADQRFTKLNNLFTLLIIVLTILYAVPAYFLSKIVAEWWRSGLPSAYLNVFPGDSLYMLVAMFLGFGLTSATFGVVTKSLWPESGAFYSSYLSVRRYRCDYDRLCRGLSVPLFLIAMTALAFGANQYVQVRQGVLALHGFFALSERTYSYSDVKRVETAVTRLNTHETGRDYLILFRDGSSLDLYRDLPSGGEFVRAEVASIVAKKAGVTIENVSDL
jgi:hypothetical protein